MLSRLCWRLTLTLACACVGLSARGEIVLNEYNAVRNDRWLDQDGLGASTATDTYFGRIVGNGGRWFEVAVVGGTSTAGETIDMRGWTFGWTSGDVGSGSFTLSDDIGLAGIHRGTVVTFFSPDVGGPNVNSNLNGIGASTAAGGDLAAYNPAGDSWWLNINLADTSLVNAGGTLSTGNENWQVTMMDAMGSAVFGPAGEGVGSLSGVNSREVGKLEQFTAGSSIADWQSVTPLNGVYQDGTSSSFGGENLWSGGANVQDFSSLRVVPEPTCLLLLGGGLGLGIFRRRR